MKVYCSEAKERVAKQGANAIADFINAVPASVRAKCLARLPPIAGFRKGSQLALKEQYKKLVNTLSHTSDVRFRTDGAEWAAFGSIWVQNSITRFGDENVLSGLPSNVTDEAGTFEYFNGLIKGRGDEGCSREELEPLYKFSGFPNSEEVETLIAALPSNETLERQRKLAHLPTEVERMRARMERLESDSLDVTKALDALRASAKVKP
jgi:hypothetical protein